ncbi:hypothetical protein F5141DRAFT_1216013 [Pisolithus sp. B1]|nr:hypothetical protein F5141DRAFT_1216013 [Pisolithus sp. B1]
MNPTSVTSADAKHALAILCQLATMEVGPTRGNEELLAGLASIEHSLRAVVDTLPATLSLPPLTPSATTSTPNNPPAPPFPFLNTHPSLSSPAHAQYDPEVNELEGSLWASTPAVDNAVLSIPLESPLAS